MPHRSPTHDSATTVVTLALPAEDLEPGDDRPVIMVTSGRAMGEIHPVGEETIVGRDPACDVVLLDDGISRRHCRLMRGDGAVYLEDLGSTNGTWVNRLRVRRGRLKHGDRIRLGVNTVLDFLMVPEGQDAPLRDLYVAASRDPLTGAYNKRFFLERLGAEVAFATRHGTPLSLIVFDCDRFKEINDRHGHATGDAVLSQLGELVLATTRAEDIVARWGGDEFAVLARGVGDRGVYLLAERLRAAVAASTFIDRGVELRLTLSLGTATTSAGAPVDGEALFRQADAALYEAKRAGRNRVAPVPM